MASSVTRRCFSIKEEQAQIRVILDINCYVAIAMRHIVRNIWV